MRRWLVSGFLVLAARGLSAADDPALRWLPALAGSYEESTAATDALVEIGEAAVPCLLSRLDTADDAMRWGLVNVLGILGSPQALEALVRAAIDHGEVHARWRAYWAISAVDDGRARGLLRPYLESSDAEVRWRAASALAFLEDPTAVPALLKGLEAAEEWRRWEAVFGLASVRSRSSWKQVAALALRDPEVTVRQEAVMTLWKLAEPDAADTLALASEDPSPQVRWRALMALAELVPQRRAWCLAKAAVDLDAEVRGAFTESR